MRDDADVLGEVGNEDADDDQAARVTSVRWETLLREGRRYTDNTGWKMPGEASSRQFGVFGSMVCVRSWETREVLEGDDVGAACEAESGLGLL